MALALTGASVAMADEQQLNLYSARHYQTDERLYENFTKQTGIKINRIEARRRVDGAYPQRRCQQPGRCVHLQLMLRGWRLLMPLVLFCAG